MARLVLGRTEEKTPLYGQTHALVQALLDELQRERLSPWSFARVEGAKGVVDAHGRTINLGGNVCFDGSRRLAYWNFFDPFIRRGVIDVLDRVAASGAKTRYRSEDYLGEAAKLIKHAVRIFLREVVSLDQRLRRQGPSDSLPSARSVVSEIASLNRFIDEHVAAKEAEAPCGRREGEGSEHWASGRISSENDRRNLFRAVLFTDLVDHTEMMQRLGDKRGRDVLRAHERIIRTLLKQYDGTEMKTLGDGFMASFDGVSKALDCAIGIQCAFASYSATMPEPLHVRIGLDAGEPIEEEGDLFGSTVILAARIGAKAGADEILIPAALRHLLAGKTYSYADRGEVILKGFENPVRLYEVHWRD